VGRWAPDARERLERAALELFVERGYESTTVADIAERAGLNRATFFRHFADKREVILAGEDVLVALFADAVRDAPESATVAECIAAAVLAADPVMTAHRRAVATRRIVVVAQNPELQERGQLKLARVAGSMAAALEDRGVDALTSRFAAEVGLLAFRIAFERWMRADDGSAYRVHAEQALDALRDRVPTILGA
jgi:AcrR family transcriptional regulator